MPTVAKGGSEMSKAGVATMMAKAYMPIRKWYLKTFPEDTFGKEINSEATFMDVFEALDWHTSVYNAIGVGDSIIRERVFDELAKITGYDLDVIYDQWMLCHE